MKPLPYGPKTHKTFVIEDKKIRIRGKCLAKSCSKLCRPSDRYCPRCQARNYKVLWPARYAYYKLRWSAIRRKIQFSLTLRDWETFWEAESLGSQYGKRGFQLTIDRIDAKKGYSIDNIQVLTNQENGRKGQIEGLDRRREEEYDIPQ